MVDRDVRRPRRIVRHAVVPRPPEAASAAATVPIPTGAPAEETVPVSIASEPQPMAADPKAADPEAGHPEAADGEAADGEAAKPSLGSMVLPDRPDGFPTEATLADQDAAAAELRQDVDQLRRLLDERPPPLLAPRKRSRKPLLGVLVVGGTLGVIATATLVPWSHLGLPDHDGAGHTVTARAGAGQHGAGQQSKVQPGQAGSQPGARPLSSPALALVPLSAPAGSMPLSGPGISSPGTMMVVQIGSDGNLDVVEQAMLGPRGLRAINLTLPSMASLGGEVAALNPTVRNLRVSVNGVPVTATPNADGSGWTVLAPSQRARMVQLSYRITQAVVISKPSDAGRALAVSLPLFGQALREQGLPLVVKAYGSQVGGVSCPGAPPAAVLCGMQAKDGWTATVPTSATSPLLILQLNLTH